jgi:hypothetical protein
MGYDLMGQDRYFRANMFLWPRLLELAYLFGWERAGTIRQDGSRTDSLDGYFVNEFYMVEEADAKAIAAALRRALANPSDPIASAKVIFGEYRPESIDVSLPGDTVRLSLVGSADREWLESDEPSELMENDLETIDSAVSVEEGWERLNAFRIPASMVEKFADFCGAGSFIIG